MTTSMLVEEARHFMQSTAVLALVDEARRSVIRDRLTAVNSA